MILRNPAEVLKDYNANPSETFVTRLLYERHKAKKEVQGEARKTTSKIILSGNVVEVYNYEQPVWYATNKATKKNKMVYNPQHINFYWPIAVYPPCSPDTEISYLSFEIVEKKESIKSDEIRKQSIRRASANIRRLASCNFGEYSKFLTLTFKDGSVDDVGNIKECNREFKKFIQRLKYRVGDFKYIAVVEFQEENDRGAVHYHVILNIPYVPHSDLLKLWGLGSVYIEAIKSLEGVDNVGAYLTYYMSKDFSNDRLQGQKSYFTSRNLKKPEILRGHDAYEAERILMELDLKLVFTNHYESEQFGTIAYREYNLKRKS